MCRRKRKATKMVKEEREETSNGDSESEEEVNRLDRDSGWPGTSTKARCRSVCRITTRDHDTEDLDVGNSDSYKGPVFKGKVGKKKGASAEPTDKTDHIVQVGRPKTSREVRSLLQGAAYDAMNGIDHHKDLTYEEEMAPLRQRQEKDGTMKHGTMRKSLVEALVGRKFEAKLANLRTNPGRGRRDKEEARDQQERELEGTLRRPGRERSAASTRGTWGLPRGRTLRELLIKKNAALLWTSSKRGGGVPRQSKSFGTLFV